MENDGIISLDDLHDDSVVSTEETVEETKEVEVEPTAEVTEEVTETVEPTAETQEEPAAETVEETLISDAMESYLAEFGIEGGVINYEDGTKVNFSDLEESEKLAILKDLNESSQKSFEQEYGLDQSEVSLLNDLRESGKSFDQMLEEAVQARLSEVSSTNPEIQSVEAMTDDAVTTKWLKDNNPDSTDEEIAEELDRLKESKFYGRNAEKFREGYVKEQEAVQKAEEEARVQAEEAEREADRFAIVEKVSDLDKIMGWSVNDNEKNEVLSRILEVNDYGDSLFMEEIFSDPERLFKAAWLYQNAESRFDQMDEYYKKEIQKAFARGKASAIEGSPSTKISSSGGSVETATKSSSVEAPREEKTTTLDDLHND